MVRLPMNLMEGVRSTCWAAWRRTLVVNMVEAEVVLLAQWSDSRARGISVCPNF
jgi:hypothetical protein